MDDLSERKPGIFYRKSQAFLHFHEDPAGLFADGRIEGLAFERLAVNTLSRAGCASGTSQTTAHEAMIDELLALDQLTLRTHTEQAGDAWDVEQQRQSLMQSLSVSKLCAVRREGALVAYATLRAQATGSWFVSGLNTHPEHRSAPVLRDLFAQMSEVIRTAGARELRSHVYKTNRLSIAFHRRLGFRVVGENEKALEFVISVDALAIKRYFHTKKVIDADVKP